MVKFDIEILEHYNHGQLLNLQQQLKKVIKLNRAMKEIAIQKGKIRLASKYEAVIIRANENMEIVDYVIICKEEQLFRFMKYESICLN